MKLLLTAILFLSITVSGYAQSVTAIFAADHQTNSPTEFPLKEGVLSTAQSAYEFGSGDSRVSIMTPIDVALSPDRATIGVVRFDGELVGEVYSHTGRQLTRKELEFVDPSDETIMISVAENGEFVVRDNVANFTFFDAAGNEGFTLSNATQAPGGEQPSGISWPAAGEAAILYNPVIQYDDSRGSRISVAVGDRDAAEIYRSQSRTISNLSLSESGNFITFLSTGNGDNRVIVIDRHGNELLDFEPDIDITGFELSEDAAYLTIFSENRVQVYRTSDMERLGSSTSRTRIVYASYQPEENMIITLGGQMSNNTINNPELTAIHVVQRQLDRHQLDGNISIKDPSDLKIKRVSAGNYRIKGINRPIDVTASF